MAKFNNAIAAFVYTSKLGLRMGDPGKSATRACYGLSDDLGMNKLEFVCAGSGVLEMVARGRLNKQIAGKLGIVEKTVKVHRARALEKLGVRSVANLVAAFNCSSNDGLTFP